MNETTIHAEMCNLFKQLQADKLTTREILNSPDAKPIRALIRAQYPRNSNMHSATMALAAMLKPFGVRSAVMRKGQAVARGYYAADLGIISDKAFV